MPLNNPYQASMAGPGSLGPGADIPSYLLPATDCIAPVAEHCGRSINCCTGI
jgi:hypothetical protein